MAAPLILLLASFLTLAASFWLPDWGDFILIAGPSVLASLWLCWRAWRTRKPTRPQAIIDGSNVMHWLDGTPRFAPLREVIARLGAQGIDPTVIFDANAGYLLADRYMHDDAMAHQLRLPVASVLVVSKGSPADETILKAAREMRARIVSNDRFRDWADRHPEVNHPGHVIRGGYRDGALWLDTDAQGAPDRGPRAPTPGKTMVS